MRLGISAILITFALSLSSCQSTRRGVVYNAYEAIGIHKRDLLKDKIQEVREDQEEVREEFRDALAAIEETYGRKESPLSQVYESLREHHEDAQEEAGELRKNVREMEQLGNDLFSEWKAELNQIQDQDLKNRSHQSLQKSQSQFERLRKSLRDSLDGLEPALVSLQDHYLAIKHEMNAQAIDYSLTKEAENLKSRIRNLEARINQAINEIDQFLKNF